MGYSDEELEQRLKLVIKELKTLPTDSEELDLSRAPSLREMPYWSALLDRIIAGYGSLQAFYESKIGLDFLSSNQTDFPSDEQEEATTQMVQSPRLLLRDTAGAGKTAPAIKTRFALEQLVVGGKVNPLVICPNFVLSSWQTKLRQYLVDNPRILTLTSSNREQGLRDFRKGILDGTLDFTLVSYDALFRIINGYDVDSIEHPETYEHRIEENEGITLTDRLLEVLDLSPHPFMMVLDECQNSKNPDAFRSKSVRKLALAADYFYPLSGNVFHDNLEDIGELASLLDNGNYPTAEDFNKAYASNPRLIRLFLRRYSKEPVVDIRNLPGMPRLNIHEPINFDLSPEERELYEAVQNYREFNPGTKMTLLRLAASDSRILLPSSHKGKNLEGHLSGFFEENPELLQKFERLRKDPDYCPILYRELDSLVEEIYKRGEKVIIWSKFREGITKELEQRYSKYGSCRIDGTVSLDPKGKRFSDRDLVRLNFQTDPDRRILVGTIDSLREGQDLHSANNVIFILRDYSPGPNDQATGRAYRIGQTKDVNVHTLAASGTINKGIYLREVLKREGIGLVDKGVELTDEQKEVLERKKSIVTQEGIRSYLMNSRALVRFMSGFMINKGAFNNSEFLGVGENAQLYAQAYEHLWDSSYSGNTARLIAKIIQETEQKEDLRLEQVADIGSGPSTISRVLLRPSMCIDINSFQLANGKRVCEKLGVNIETLVANAEDLGLRDEQYDLSVLSLVLHYGNWQTGGRKRMVLEANRILKDNGKCIITLPKNIVQGDGRKLLEEGLYSLGLEPLGDRTGFVEAIDNPKKDFQVYVAVCKKIHPNNPDLYNSDRYNGNFILNPDFVYKDLSEGNEGNESCGNPENNFYRKEIYNLFRFVESGDVIGIARAEAERAQKIASLIDLFDRYMVIGERKK